MIKERIKVVEDVLAEVRRAEDKFPGFPADPLHALAVLGEEFGELTQAVLQQQYEPEKNEPAAVRKEAIHTAAMAIRFLFNMDKFQSTKNPAFIITP